MAADEAEDRTLTEVILKTLTTHAFALASYANASTLLRRPLGNGLAFRVIFFAFVPTLPLVEICINAARALIKFVADFEDEDKLDAWYFLSGALGVHARLPESKKEETQMQNLPLLQTDRQLLERKPGKLDWAWFGRVLATLFTLTQAVGTIVMWVRRMDSDYGNCLGFDHRNGALGVASAICGTVSLLVLVLRLNWVAGAAFQAPPTRSPASTHRKFAIEALLALLTHLVIATIANDSNEMLYTSAGVLFFLCRQGGRWWQTIIVAVLMVIFRKELAAKLRIYSAMVERVVGVRRWTTIRILLSLALALWVLVDIVWLFVADILEIVHSRSSGYWWQDPISDQILVL